MEGAAAPRKPRLTRLVALIVAVAAFSAIPAGASAEITAPGYYKMTYADTVFRYMTAPGVRLLQPLTYEAWIAAGQPTPQMVQSAVVKYAWSPTLYAVTFFEGAWRWDRLNLDMWGRMGFQAPYDAGWILGSNIRQYGSTQQELFVVGEDGSIHKLTLDEWAATGYRPVTNARFDLGFARYGDSPTVFEVHDYGTSSEWQFALTWDQWLAQGAPTPAQRPPADP